MPLIKSTVNTASTDFKANAAAMGAVIADLQAKRAEAAVGGPLKLRERHASRSPPPPISSPSIAAATASSPSACSMP